MRGYEKHEFSAEMSKPAPEGIIDPMAAMRETPIETPPDEWSRLQIEEIQMTERMREREEHRPVEPVAPAAAAFTPVSEPEEPKRMTLDEVIAAWDESGAIKTSAYWRLVSERDRNLKNQKI